MYKARENLTVKCCSIFFALILFVLTTKAYAEVPASTRLYGNDRYETAIAVSRHGWDTAQYAVLARGDDFPDALCAGPLAKKYNAPILLTQTNELGQSVLDELKRLKVKNVFIIGGVGAVSQNVENSLVFRGYAVERIAGSDRFETSVKIAQKIGKTKEVFIATGNDFPDALSISAIAAIRGTPILLSEKAHLPDKVKQYIGTGQMDKSYVIGGQGVVTDAVMGMLPDAERISGNNRFETNAAVMEKFSGNLSFNEVYLAVADGPYGDEFADALSGSVLAAKGSSPVVLVYKELPPAVEYFVKPNMTPESRVIALGGEAVVPAAIVNDLMNLSKTGVYIKALSPPSSIGVGETKEVAIEVYPKDAEVTVSSNNEGVVSAGISGNAIYVKGISRGTAVITVTAKKAGHNDGITSFLISPPVYNVTKDEYYDGIQKAIDSSSEGDTIKVAPGVYYEHLTISRNNLKLIGVDRDTTIIDATQNGKNTRAGIKFLGASGVELKNITVRNAGVNITKEKSREPYGIYALNSDKNLFDNIKLQGNGEYEIYFYDGCDLNTVQYSIIDGKSAVNDSYLSLDGIFSSGGVAGPGAMNIGNSFIGNEIKNVVIGISLTASQDSKILNNRIDALDSSYWSYSESAGIVLSNSSTNQVQGNAMTGAKFGVRLSVLSGISPFAYAGAPNNNTISMNTINNAQNGVRVMGVGNIVQYNSIGGSKDGNGIWIADTANNTEISRNILAGDSVGMLVENTYNKIQYNKFDKCTTGIKNATSMVLDASKNYWENDNPAGFISGSISYSPWFGNVDDTDLSTPGFQAPLQTAWCTDGSLKDVVDMAATGDTIQLLNNKYVLSSQLVINKNLTIKGLDAQKSIISIGFDTTNTDDGRAAVVIGTGASVNFSDVTIDGYGHNVMEGVRVLGSGIFGSVAVKNIRYSQYNGWGIMALGNSNVTVTGSNFNAIEGASVGSAQKSKLTVKSNTFTGNGYGDLYQFAVYAGDQSAATIKNNIINGYEGFTAVNNNYSAGIYIASGKATIESNKVSKCRNGIVIVDGAVVNRRIDPVQAGAAVESYNSGAADNSYFNVVVYDKDLTNVLYPAVTTVGQLQEALMNPNTSTVVIKKQIVIDSNVVLNGNKKTIKFEFDTESSGDSAGAILITKDGELNLSNVTLDGLNRKINDAIYNKGKLTLNNVNIMNIFYSEKTGDGVESVNGTTAIQNSSFINIEGAAVNIGGSSEVFIDNSIFDGSTGADHISYAIKSVSFDGGSSKTVITNNTIKNYKYVSDSGESAGIYIQDGKAVIIGNTIENNQTGIALFKNTSVGIDPLNMDASETITGENANKISDSLSNINKISNNANAVKVMD